MGDWQRSVGNFGITVGKDGVGIWENDGGSVFTSTGGGCSLEAFLDGQLNDAVRGGFLAEALAEVERLLGPNLAAVKRTIEERRRRRGGFEVTVEGLFFYDDRGDVRATDRLEAFLGGALQRELYQRAGYEGLEAAIVKARDLSGIAAAPIVEGEPCDRCARIIRVSAALGPDDLPKGLSRVAIRPNPNGYTAAFRCSSCGTCFANREREWTTPATDRLSRSLADRWVIAADPSGDYSS